MRVRRRQPVLLVTGEQERRPRMRPGEVARLANYPGTVRRLFAHCVLITGYRFTYNGHHPTSVIA